VKLDPHTSHGMLPARLWSLILAARIAGLRDSPPTPERLRAIELKTAEQLNIGDIDDSTGSTRTD
jgi:hypothetical protein